jgi:nitrate reductase assembly molybdenum cofactor insertion protein NarJ
MEVEKCSPGKEAKRMDEELALAIERLRKQKTKALQAHYRELFGEETRSSNHAHLFRRIAWRLIFCRR